MDFGTPAEDRVAIDPFVSVSNSLRRRTRVEVLRVTATQPMYIRLVALPTFDGVQWRPSEVDQASILGSGEAIPMEDGVQDGLSGPSRSR